MDMHYPDNPEIYKQICIPTLDMVLERSPYNSRYNRWNKDDYPDYIRAEIYHQHYMQLRAKWPQINERTQVSEFNGYDSMRIPFTPQRPIAPRSMQTTLKPGIKPAIYRALRESILHRRSLMRSKQITRLTFWLLKEGFNEFVPSPTADFITEDYHLERVDFGMNTGFTLEPLYIPFRGFYVPRIDTLFFRRLWDVRPDYQTADPNSPTFYTLQDNGRVARDAMNRYAQDFFKNPARPTLRPYKPDEESDKPTWFVTVEPLPVDDFMRRRGLPAGEMDLKKPLYLPASTPNNTESDDE